MREPLRNTIIENACVFDQSSMSMIDPVWSNHSICGIVETSSPGSRPEKKRRLCSTGCSSRRWISLDTNCSRSSCSGVESQLRHDISLSWQ